MGYTVCLDTDILIWGIKREADPGKEEMIEKTENFFAWLEKENHTVLIPAVVLAEFLVGIPAQEHADVLALFQRDFLIPPADAMIASLYAVIWQTNKNHGLPADTKRQALKIDGLVVATAVMRKAHVLYSEDKGIAQLANGYIDVQPIPSIPRQPGLL